MPADHVHVITPGDHFSPRTGSAVPTVVHGLAAGRSTDRPRPHVVVARGTYPERYDSAEIIEYEQATGHRLDRQLDAGLSRLGAPRIRARRAFAATVASQSDWPPAVVFGHNAVQLNPSIDHRRHTSVLYAHNHLLRTYSRRESSRVLGGVDAIICVSDFLASQMAPHLPDNIRSRMFVVHNGVDSTFFSPDPSRIRAEKLELLFVGRVLPEKGPDVVLEAMRRLDRPDLHLTIVGAAGFDPAAPLTAYENQLRILAEPMGTRVTFRPFLPRPEVATQLRSADVCLVPSRWADPCPLTVLEGMASGAVVIGSDIGGIPESMGGAGIVVPPDDPVTLAAAIESLADDHTALAAARETCRAHAVAHNWAAVARQLDDLMDRTL